VISGKASAALVAVCLIATALLIPWALRRPPWIEAESVLAAWWAIWTAALAGLLYTGRWVSDDYAIKRPGSPGDWFDSTPVTGVSDVSSISEAIVVVVLGVLAMVFFALAAWIVVELAIPAVAVVAYLLIRGMLSRVANDRHGCEGRLDRAVLWAVVWATGYTAPLGVAVWLVHRFLGGGAR
jgi:hypothetical protein